MVEMHTHGVHKSRIHHAVDASNEQTTLDQRLDQSFQSQTERNKPSGSGRFSNASSGLSPQQCEKQENCPARAMAMVA
jgi:hypothetical protein